jgi:very-short-patch-repair endonuclease
MAALLYAGKGSVLTGPVALRRHGLAVAPQTGLVDVLVPRANRRQDAGFIRLHRSSLLPAGVCAAGEICFALPPRAVADAVRGMTDLREVRAVVAGAVQRGICPIARLTEELADGPVQGSARLRQALAEDADGIRSVAEADLHDLITRSHLPEPMFNPRLFDGATFIATPDCWWPDAGVAVEVDSREWHLSPRDWERTLARHARMGAHGIVVLHFTLRQIRTKPDEVVSTIRAALAAGRGRPRTAIRALPAQ